MAVVEILTGLYASHMMHRHENIHTYRLRRYLAEEIEGRPEPVAV